MSADLVMFDHTASGATASLPLSSSDHSCSELARVWPISPASAAATAADAAHIEAADEADDGFELHRERHTDRRSSIKRTVSIDGKMRREIGSSDGTLSPLRPTIWSPNSNSP